MQTTPDFDPHSLASKLRHAAAELRRTERQNLGVEHFARRLEAHADAMLRPEAADGRLFTLRDTRLAAHAARQPRAAPGPT